MKVRCRAFRRMWKADIYGNLKITPAYLASINRKLSRSKHHRMFEPHFISCLRCTSKKKGAHRVIA